MVDNVCDPAKGGGHWSKTKVRFLFFVLGKTAHCLLGMEHTKLVGICPINTLLIAGVAKRTYRGVIVAVVSLWTWRVEQRGWCVVLDVCVCARLCSWALDRWICGRWLCE